jgi:AhpD family alkylhydroperoxidase
MHVEEDAPPQRLNYAEAAPEALKAVLGVQTYVNHCGLDHSLLELVKLRASQINGCAFCVDMHVKEATIRGERPLRLHHVAIWRESSLFSERERAALAWTEALTRLPPEGVPDDLYDHVRAHFDDKGLADLTYAIMAINGWNRISIGFRAEPGSRDAEYGLTRAGLS